MIKKFICIVAMIFIAGCSVSLSEEGQAVRIVDNKQTYDCESLGTASSFDELGADSGHQSENALNKLRNKAAEKGGNAIKIISIDAAAHGASATGEILKCSF